MPCRDDGWVSNDKAELEAMLCGVIRAAEKYDIDSYDLFEAEERLPFVQSVPGSEMAETHHIGSPPKNRSRNRRQTETSFQTPRREPAIRKPMNNNQFLFKLPNEMLADIRECANSLALSSSAFIRLAIAQAVRQYRAEPAELLELKPESKNEGRSTDRGSEASGKALLRLRMKAISKLTPDEREALGL